MVIVTVRSIYEYFVVCLSYNYSVCVVNLLILLWMCVWLRTLSIPCLIPCACIIYLTRGSKDILSEWNDLSLRHWLSSFFWPVSSSHWQSPSVFRSALLTVQVPLCSGQQTRLLLEGKWLNLRGDHRLAVEGCPALHGCPSLEAGDGQWWKRFSPTSCTTYATYCSLSATILRSLFPTRWVNIVALSR